MANSGVFFVYKFKVKGTGYFYIGVTTDIDRRKSTHISQLNCIINRFRFIPLRKDAVLNGYRLVAAAIVKGRRTLTRKNCLNKNLCIITVLDIKDTPKEAAAMEDFLLKKHKNNPKCFNKCKYSNYAYTNKKKQSK